MTDMVKLGKTKDVSTLTPVVRGLRTEQQCLDLIRGLTENDDLQPDQRKRLVAHINTTLDRLRTP